MSSSSHDALEPARLCGSDFIIAPDFGGQIPILAVDLAWLALAAKMLDLDSN